MAKAAEYKYIQAWHSCTGSMPYYWKNLQQKAEQENAPLDAIYRRTDDLVDADKTTEWATVSNLPADNPMRERMESYLREIQREKINYFNNTDR